MSDPRQITLTSQMRDTLAKHVHQHKYDHGHALILSGGVGRGGAARLAARGALRVGAGLVTLACPPAALIENAAQLTAIMLRSIRDGDALAALLEDARINALCVGPGLGQDRARDLVPVALAARRATVVDADGLGAFADAPDKLFGLLHDACILTPHSGEFARLFPDIAERLVTQSRGGANDGAKVSATQAAARRAGCVVLYKGAQSVIAGPDGDVAIFSAQGESAAPWLASAGTGDVLAGFAVGLLARGIAPMQAAETAVWLHAGAARRVGPGLIAEDLPEALPGLFRDLGL